ncbi:RNA-dependent RNA polymerase, eukaryotic-type [Corchorus olitorius]|uniref:RNA-dependent RNA polymerase n=1 Tax=Corchorus olitorius TaxID=93759 RepID=A0A1R3HQ79_9ROSI|nr:RNA-dependent RNA polymerase, eukaryotic-type [Corchorus olitorius]
MGKTIKLFGFASAVSQEEVIEFLEEYTGKGTIEAVEVGQSKREGSRAHAKVQFKTEEDAKRILSWTADQALWHKSSYLKAWTLNHDIIPQPKSQSFNLQSIDNLMLHIGCQVSREKFYVLWKHGDVSMKFGLKLDRLYFFLTYNSVDYKLELFDDNVWQIMLHYPLDQTKKFLIIQLLGAPRIYEKDVSIPISSKEVPDDDQWIREVDFTPGNCIGQSFGLCLELPRGVKLPKFDQNFYYKKVEDKFSLEKGSIFSSNPVLVPIIVPPQGFDLPYSILFKVNSLVQHGCLPVPTLDANFFKLIDPSRINSAFIEHALEKLYSFRECCYEPVKWLDEQYKKYRESEKPPRPLAVVFDNGLVTIRRAQVTPSKVYFSGPEVNLSNRVLRNYINHIDNFLRVSFVDEELGKIRSTDLSSSTSVTSDGKRTKIYDRILSTLKNGLVIGDKKFEFLACSTSQLRENSIWMFASKPGLTAVDIREKMGHIHVIRNVAKYAARLGQSLSSSRETLEVKMNEIKIIPDIDGGTKYNFSDGIGKISAKLAKAVAGKCGLRTYTPSAFQIRYGGYKGVVAVDPTSSVKLSLRKSMQKFDADSTSLDVLSWSKKHPCYLNRQIIILLSTLGVEDIVFEKKQKEVTSQLDAILMDPERAKEAMEWISHGEITNVLREMLMCGYNPDSEPFLSMMLRTIRASKLLDLRTKTRIFVENGRSMMGCLDETGTLEYGQVFLQCSGLKPRQFSDDSLLTFSDGRVNKNCHVVEGTVVVAKNPCLHPGDIRVLKAVNAVVLHHMVDCIVFPQKGHRPHPNECSGSDLDGDMYFVSWDEDLIPPCRFPPMDYDPAASTHLDHDVTIEEVAEYFTNYILNDSLGIISNAHTVFADKEPTKALSEECIELAKLSSIAVDFPKTGIPAKIPHRLRVQQYPDFMEKPDKFTYESQSVIGKLYREVKAIATGVSDAKHFTMEVAEQSYDFDMEVDGFLAYVNDAFHYKSVYDNKLANLMRYYGVKTEAEMMSGCIMKMSKSFDRRRDLETVVLAVKSLRKEARGWFYEKGDDDELEYSNVVGGNVLAKASAWYHVTYHPNFWGFYNDTTDQEHFISFPWCIYDKLIQIKKENSSKKSSFEGQANRGDRQHQKTSWWDLCSLM